jgi:galactokinase/mevalonate kinase-like predicted kinase
MGVPHMTQTIVTTSSHLAAFSSTKPAGAQQLVEDLQHLSTGTFLTADPDLQRLGSGGGTVNALFNAWQASKTLRSGSKSSRFSEWLLSDHRLVLHAGGESRRLPAYGAVGKALMPMPREAGVQPRLPRPLLADYQVHHLQQTLRGSGAVPRVMVASGDVYLDFDASKIAQVETDFTGVGMRVNAEVAQHFGVYFVPKVHGRDDSGKARSISFFLQKPSPAEVRHFEAKYDFYVDTGIWLLSPPAVNFLFARCGWSEKAQKFHGNGGIPLPLDLYTEIGCALGSEIKAPPALQKLGFGRLTASVIPLETARFYHLGSSRQLLESMEEMQRNALSVERFFCIASRADHFIPTDRASVWIEASSTSAPIRLGGNNLLTGLPRGAQLSHLGAHVCVDVAPVDRQTYVFRPYHIDDTNRGVPGAGGKICGRDAAEWLAARGFPVSKEDVFDLPLYPVVSAGEISQAWLDWFFSDHPDLEISRRIAQLPRISARAILSRVNFDRYFAQRREGYAEQFRADFQRLIDQGDSAVLEQDCASLAAFCRDQSPALATWLRKNREPILSALHRPELQARFILLLSELAEGETRAELTHEGFSRLQNAMVTSRQLAKMNPRRSLKEDQIVWGRSPVRLDLAGGWTDTPPFCLQAGGSVVNVAVLLNGQPPIQVFVRPTADSCVQLRSIDLGSAETVNTYDELADFRNPRGHFSLPKAALAMAGFLPEFFAGKPYRTLRAHLTALGGGLEISLLSAVPKGSGLGTSSILAATILGALNRACGLGWDELDLYNRVLGVEQLLTTGGGWQDQAGAIFPGLKLIETQPGPTQQPSVRYLPTQLVGPDILNRQLLLYYTGATRMAKGILQEIVRDMFLGRADTLRTLEAIRSNARRLYHDLHGGDTNALHQSIARSWTLNKQLDAGTTTPEIERVIATCGSDLAACKLLGAGGGGYMLICAKNAEAGSRIRQNLEASPPNPRARFIDFAISQTGLEVTVS